MVHVLAHRARRLKSKIPRIAVERLGVPPGWMGYRYWGRETLPDYADRRSHANPVEVVHAERIHHGALPMNVDDRSTLPDDRGWWGFSFQDVPARRNDPTLIATVPDCLVAHYRQPPGHRSPGDYYVGILNKDRRSVELREVRFRERHADVLRSGAPTERLSRATWVIERVFHNYSHWLSAHLPKFLLLQERDELGDVLLPPDLPTFARASLRILGFPSEDFRTFDPTAVQRVDELTVLDTDRFRPELVRKVRDAVWEGEVPAPRRRIFISRQKVDRRRLLNEEQMWRLLEPLGFERVVMEELPFEAQVELMKDTRVLVGSHGAGLTNMIFCAPGTQVLEIADLSFPNPNFYALASGLGHDYWLAEGDPVGEGHPLILDMVADEEAVRDVVLAILAQAGT
ncbi:MAG: glycosyltransferase family 61 protein [Gemmatimonadota bacterium]